MTQITPGSVKLFSILSRLACLFAMGTMAFAGDFTDGTKSETENAGHVRALFPLDDSDWKMMESIADVDRLPNRPLAQILYRLRQRHVEDAMRERLVSPEKRVGLSQGDVVEWAEDVFVRKITFHDLDAENAGPEFKRCYVCNLLVADRAEVVCVTSRIPQAWLGLGKESRDGSVHFDPPRKTGFLGLLVTPGTAPVFVAARLRDCSDSLLNRYGFDVSLLDDVKPISVRDLKTKKVPPEKLRVLKFTASDFEPFYRMLVTASAIPPSEIDDEIKTVKKNEASTNDFFIRDLFNRPESQQGCLVRLSGYARRIERIAVTDEEAAKRFGIDHYYQVAFFTQESQDNPIMICMTDLPDGVSTGGGKTFNVPMSISAFFYKIWAYEKMEGLSYDTRQAVDSTGKAVVRNNIQFAPLLIGAKIDWHRKPEVGWKAERSFDFSIFTIAAFCFLVLAWIFFRLLRPRSPVVRFRLIPETRRGDEESQGNELPDSGKSEGMPVNPGGEDGSFRKHDIYCSPRKN